MTSTYHPKKLKHVSFPPFILIAIVSFVASASSFIAVQAQPTDTFNNPYKTKELIIGVRTAAEPIGNDVRESRSGGICGVFGKELERRLGQSNIKVKYTTVKNNYLGGGYGRYDGLRQNVIHVECGPNSRPSSSLPGWASEIRFSETPFYETGIKLLLKESTVEALPEEGGTVDKLAGKVTVLVSRNTTTYTELKESLSNAQVIPVDSRDEALDLLEQSEDYAYASDALIVKTLLTEGVQELTGTDGKTIREPRERYRAQGYTIYPPDKSYLFGETEDYVMAIHEGTPYEEDLMEAVEATIKSSKLEAERQKLKNAETVRSLSPEPTPSEPSPEPTLSPEPTPPEPLPEDSLGIWTLATFIGLPLILFLLYFGNERRKEQAEKQRTKSNVRESTSGTSNFNFNINNSPMTEIGSTVQGGSGHTSQVMTRKQEQDEIVEEIRQLLEPILAETKSYSRSRSRAFKKGEKLHEENATLSRRLTKALEVGTISAIESAVDHPLASFFVDGFKAFRNGEN